VTGQKPGILRRWLRVVFQATLLRSIGCTSHASENADEFGDDIAFQAALKELDVGDPEVLRHQLAAFGSWAGAGQQAELARRFVEAAPVKGPAANAAACEVGRALGPQLGLSAGAVAALDQVYERWDGHGIPGRRSGEQLALAARIGHLAEQAVLAHAHGARRQPRRRSGGGPAAISIPLWRPGSPPTRKPSSRHWRTPTSWPPCWPRSPGP
jgi:HD domain